MSSPLKVTRRKALVIADWMLDTHDGVREYHEKITLCERLVIQPKAPPPPEPPGPLMQSGGDALQLQDGEEGAGVHHHGVEGIVMLTSDEEDYEMRRDFGGLWTVGYFLALCGMATVITVLQRIGRRVRR